MGKKIFFAYESGHPENRDAITRAVREFNKYQSKYNALTWEDMEINGRIINKTIFEEIDRSEIFACDLTYINHNVLFELGYAIGRRKKLLIFLNDSVFGAKENYGKLKLLKNVGYSRFNNYKEILVELQEKEKMKTDLLEQVINLEKIQNDDNDIFYITSKVKNQAFLELSEYINSTNLRVVNDDTSEVEYQPLYWYIKNLYSSSYILIHLVGEDKHDNEYYNAEYSIYAGLGCGFEKKVLLIAPKPFTAPIDYDDILIEYNGAEECVKKVANWIENNIFSVKEQEREERSKQEKYAKQEKKFNLLKLGIGCEIAEEEKNDLINYFVEIDGYNKAMDRSKSVFVGRKGSGKSAIFIKLIHDLSLDGGLNYNVILKPDSDELLENVELSDLYNSERSKKSFFKTVWKYVIYSKLFLLIKDKIQYKHKSLPSYTFSKLENEINDFYEINHNIIGHNFFGAISSINEFIKGKRIVDDPHILEEFYKKIIGPMQKMIVEYFNEQKYFNVNILADNLDKTWEAKNELEIQSEMILSLLEYSNDIVDEILYKKSEELKVNTIIFLRTDIFEYILKRSREPDKLIVRSYEINWDKYPELLRKLIEKRFKFTLDIKTKEEIDKVWNDYFNLSENQHPYDIVKSLIINRPRDIIYFMSKLFESAVNNDNEKVSKQDLKYAIDAYSSFIQGNIEAEMKAEFPKIKEVLDIIRTEFIDGVLEYSRFEKLLLDKNYSKNKIGNILKGLFEKGYLTGWTLKGKKKIKDYLTLEKMNKERILFLFRRHEIYLATQDSHLQVYKKFQVN